MESLRMLTDQIAQNNGKLDRHAVKKVLILYEEKVFFIGDTCLRFDKFRYCRLFFSQASVHLNISNNEKYLTQYKELVQGNPYIDKVESLQLMDISYGQYDAVVCVIPDEGRLLTTLQEKYGAVLVDVPIRFAVFSLSSIYINQDQRLNILPKYEALVEFYRGQPDNQLHELYIDLIEREKADKWLENQGVADLDDLFIFLDSSARRDKLLRMDVYFSVLKGLLLRPRTKVLIFDEKNIGKEDFYRAWLGNELCLRLIFAKSLPLRDDLALLASSYTKMVFGPCTGLLHCAAGIYNKYIRDGMPGPKVPILVAYTGKYQRPGENAADWWAQCPLVTCLLLKNRQGVSKIVELSSLPPLERRRTDDVLPCKEYSSEMLLTVLSQKLEKFRRAVTIKS